MSAFSLLKGKIQYYYYTIMLDINKNNWHRVIKCLLREIDFENIEMLYDDDLSPKNQNKKDQFFELFCYYLYKLYPLTRKMGNKVVYVSSYERVLTNCEYQNLVDLLGKRLLACYKVVAISRSWYGICDKTSFLIDFKNTRSLDYDIKRFKKWFGDFRGIETIQYPL